MKTEHPFALVPGPSFDKHGKLRTIYRPVIRIILTNPATGAIEPTIGLVDSGSDFCLFPGWMATGLGHNLKKGRERPVNGVCGSITAYLHTTCIAIPDIDYTFRCDCYFSEGFKGNNTAIGFYGLLGLHEFFEQFSVTIDYNRRRLMISKNRE